MLRKIKTLRMCVLLQQASLNLLFHILYSITVSCIAHAYKFMYIVCLRTQIFCNKWPFFVALSRQSLCCNQVVVDLVESSKDELWSKELSSVAFGGWLPPILNPHAFGPANFILPRILFTSACVSFYNDDRQDLITCWQNVFTISQ